MKNLTFSKYLLHLVIIYIAQRGQTVQSLTLPESVPNVDDLKLVCRKLYSQSEVYGAFKDKKGCQFQCKVEDEDSPLMQLDDGVPCSLTPPKVCMNGKCITKGMFANCQKKFPVSQVTDIKKYYFNKCLIDCHSFEASVEANAPDGTPCGFFDKYHCINGECQ